MSAEVLRAAARLMRERAEAATSSHGPGSWRTTPSLDPENEGWIVAFGSRDDDFDTTVARLPYDFEGDLAPHIASWHPAVALAVADLLDIVEAGYDDYDANGPAQSEMQIVSAWADNLANAYLSDSPSPAVESPMPAAGEVTTGGGS